MERLFKRRYSLVCVVIHSGSMNGIRIKSYMNESGWKSGMLLKVTRDIKKYNAGIVPSKPGKKPCVLYITMENGISESVERMFNMCVSQTDIRGYTPKQVVKMIKDSGEFKVNGEDNINIIMQYYANRTIDTADLYTIVDDLEDEGYEVIALVLDYLKRIRPAEKGKDEKEELKNITNELKSLAVELNIPVITAHQLNRSGAASVDAAMQANKEDLGRFLGRANVGSAWEIVENVDWACIINVERKRSTGQYYLTFKRVKIRYRELSDLAYFNHPFSDGNKMQLLDDLYLEESLSEDSLAVEFDGVNLSQKKGKRSAVERDSADEDLFDFSKSL